MQAHAVPVSWHLISSTWAYVRWKRMRTSSPLRGELHAERVCLLIKVRGRGAVSSDDPPFAAGAKHRCQPPSRYPVGNVLSQLTAGGEERLDDVSCSERLRSSCEPSTKTHCIRLLKQDMTHASFPYASLWQVIRQSHNSCSAAAAHI